MLNSNTRQSADDSSSEDETSVQALKEAADCQFFNESLYSKKAANSSEEKSVKTDDKSSLKSLRKGPDDTEKFETFGVSQSYRDFVAKKLEELLNSSVKLKTINDSIVNNDQQQLSDNGIKLLSTSKEFLSTDENLKHEGVNKKRKKKIRISKKCTDDNLTNLEKIQEAAVDPDWVLSKEDTKAWVNKRNDLEFKYKKLKSGVLIQN